MPVSEANRSFRQHIFFEENWFHARIAKQLGVLLGSWGVHKLNCMATTLLDHLRSVFTSSASAELARTLSETPTNTQKALDGLLPALVSGVANAADSPQGVAKLHGLLSGTKFDTDPSLEQLVGTGDHRRRAAESGNDLLRQLVTDRPQRLAEATAQYSGVSQQSANTLTGLVMSVLMGFLNRQVQTRPLNDTQLGTYLRGDATGVRAMVPGALAALLGWFVGTGTPVRPEPIPTPIRREETDDKVATPWLRWLLIGSGLLLLLWFLTRSCGTKEAVVTTQTDTTVISTPARTDTIATATNTTAQAEGPTVRVAVDLPGGRKLNVAENSFNFSLAQFLATKGGQTPKVFTFDNLTFETNSAQITATARPNVDDLIQIMQAYPNMAIRIEGNTDSTGPDALNDQLSADRADAVKAELLKAGIAATRVATRERGDSKPVASNATEEGREQNRRIDVVVTKL